MIDALLEALSRAGFGVSAVGRLGAYNREVRPIAPDFALPDFGREDALVVLVGNGAELLGALRDAAARDPALAGDPDPIDRHARRSITALAREHLAGQRALVRFACDPPPRTFAAVRLARHLGLAETGPTQLSIHPSRGPWIAFRAAIVVDAPGPAPPPVSSRCEACRDRPCAPAMERALEAIGGLERLGRGALRRHADRFIAARDACPVGRAERYPEALLRYHYTLDRALLFPS